MSYSWRSLELAKIRPVQWVTLNAAGFPGERDSLIVYVYSATRKFNSKEEDDVQSKRYFQEWNLPYSQYANNLFT